MKNYQLCDARELMQAMGEFAYELYMTPWEEKTCQRIVDYDTFSGNCIYIQDINYFINNFAPILYGKSPL